MLHHMQLVGDHVEGHASTSTGGPWSSDLYGSPSEAVLKQMRQISGSGVPVTIQEAAALDRLPER